MTTKTRSTGDTVTLRDYVDTRLEAIKLSIEVALRAMDLRMEAANEFRATIEALVHNAITRIEYTADLRRVLDDIKFLRESRAELEGKASQDALNKTSGIAVVGLAIGVIGFLMSVISFVLQLSE